jgi:serine/threonine protein kinase
MKLLSGFPFILDLHYCFQSANFLYLIIDICPNGDFTNLESINNPKLFFAEVVLAFEYLHNKGVIYRDLKPDNILLDEFGHIKLCDFNLAKSGMTRTKRANSFCGSPLYFSPEMVNIKGATYKCDIYGIGLLMYEIVTGQRAYAANDINELYDKIKKNKINFNHPKLEGDVKDLIMKMCTKEEEFRIEIEDIKKHKYFSDIDFDKVLRKEYGNIVTVKKNSKKKKNKNETNDDSLNEDIEYKKFMEQQKIIDEDKSLNILNGKITLKEMKLDQSKPMKNKVREFYYVKKEDIDKAQEFELEIKGDNEDISSLIIEQYDA